MFLLTPAVPVEWEKSPPGQVWHQVVELHMATSHNDAALQAAAKRLEVAQRNKASIKAPASRAREPSRLSSQPQSGAA